MTKKAKYNKIIPLRLTSEQWYKIQMVAEKEILPVSVWMRKILVEKVNKGK